MLFVNNSHIKLITNYSMDMLFQCYINITIFCFETLNHNIILIFFNSFNNIQVLVSQPKIKPNTQ
ncbi:hypothetical protein FLAT13_00655 [Flavobacterium salmonis]|uniref:Uncharacterized protein n=1 Tax=Flavobacterium salmonis TaxID=2654844 RepID=A0A6V6YQ56_9FLAO|nr:hypothetical protein FLAT13_00655 [Flavobacterium salmonis]